MLVLLSRFLIPGLHPGCKALALPLLGVSAAVQINSLCVGPGSCSNLANLTDAVQANAPVSGSTSNNITIGTDTYSVATTFNTSYGVNGSELSFVPTITYTGAAPAPTSDTIPVDATGSGQLFIDGQALPLVGPYGTGSYLVHNSESLTGLTGDYLAFDYQFIFSFTAGLPPGSVASAPNPPTVPEPAEAIPAALSLIGLGLVARRRLNKS